MDRHSTNAVILGCAMAAGPTTTVTVKELIARDVITAACVLNICSLASYMYMHM